MWTQRRPRCREWSDIQVRVALLSLLLGAAACSRGGEPEAAAPTLRVEYAGCETVYRGPAARSPVCVLGEDRELRLWVGAPAGAEIELAADGRPLTCRGTTVQGGLRFDLAIPEGAGELAVRAAATGGKAVWILPLADSDRPPWFQRVEELRAGRQAEAARRLLEEKIDSSSSLEQGVALGRLARLELQRGEPQRAEALLIRAIDAHRETGRIFDQHRDAAPVLFLRIQDRRFSEARALLEALPPMAQAPAEAAYFGAYYRGLLAGRVGDSRSALRHLGAAAEQAERLGLAQERRWAEQVLGWNLRRLGRSREAARIYSRLEDEESQPCDRALLLTNHAWSLLLALEAGESAADPVPLLEEALQIYRAHSGECFLPVDRRVNVLINLALAHVHAGRPDLAREYLDRGRELAPSLKAHEVLWRLDIEARLDVAAGRPEAALELYAELAELAATTRSPEARWRSAVGRARAFEALGRRRPALDALARAEALLDEESLQVPLDEGRETFLAQRQSATRLYIDLLLDSGRDREAFEVARRSRSRVLRGLRRGDRLAHLTPEEQERWDRTIAEYQVLREQLDAEGAGDWRLPADQLRQMRQDREAGHRELRRVLDRALAILDVRPPGPLPPLVTGEVTLAYHPLPRGWAGFAATERGLTARRLGPLEDALADPAELAARLLSPFAAEIAAARRVRVLPYGPLRAVDFHALPFNRDALLAFRPVVYGLDLAPAVTPRSGPRRALLVADPNSDLSSARAEVAAVRRSLEADSEAWDVEILEGPEAHGERVRRALPRANLFHYAGHAAFAGRGGWESALPLARDTRLTVGDILALERVPEWVVLSGCETARSSLETPLESIGLAHAYLASGSQRVIAAVRPVTDRAAAALVAALYREGGGVPDLEALRRAQLSWRRRDPAADWASFRAVEP
jgi:tetratricopeptide (TPR) repeat protein